MPHNPCCCTASCGVCSDGDPSTGTLTISGLAHSGVGCPCVGANAINGSWVLPRNGCTAVANSIWLAACSGGGLLMPVGGNVVFYGASTFTGSPSYVLTSVNCSGTTVTAYAQVFVGRSQADPSKVAVKVFFDIRNNGVLSVAQDGTYCGIASGNLCVGQSVPLTTTNWGYFGFPPCSPVPTLTWTFA